MAVRKIATRIIIDGPFTDEDLVVMERLRREMVAERALVSCMNGDEEGAIECLGYLFSIEHLQDVACAARLLERLCERVALS